MRLFTGLSIEPPSSDILAGVLHSLRPLAALKWSPLPNLHITTKFIGEWPQSRLADLQSALEQLPVSAPIPIHIAHFGYFPNPHRPHSLFAAVESSSELTSLARRIDETVSALGGIKEDRPYLPHVTLARIKDQRIQALREHIASMTDLDFGSFPATSFHLYLSENGLYTRLASYPLGQAA